MRASKRTKQISRLGIPPGRGSLANPILFSFSYEQKQDLVCTESSLMVAAARVHSRVCCDVVCSGLQALLCRGRPSSCILVHARTCFQQLMRVRCWLQLCVCVHSIVSGCRGPNTAGRSTNAWYPLAGPDHVFRPCPHCSPQCMKHSRIASREQPKYVPMSLSCNLQCSFARASQIRTRQFKSLKSMCEVISFRRVREGA